MNTTTVLSQHEYDKVRSRAVQVEIYRKEVSLSEFKIVNRKYIELDGTQIEITHQAMQRLLVWFKIPLVFAKRFEEGYGEDGLAKLVEMIKNQQMAKKDRKFTLAVNPNTRQIIDVLPPKYASITNESFLDLVEQYIDQYNLDVTHFGYDDNGTTQLNCTTNGIYTVDGHKNEVFSTGVSFRNDASEGLVVSPYMTRLICTNGMTSTSFQEKTSLHTFSYHNMRKFNNHMADLASVGFQPLGIGEQIKGAMSTNASLDEVNGALRSMVGSNDATDPMYLQRYLPTQQMYKAYSNLDHDPNDFNKAQLKAANSGMSVWQVVNAMTNFASNDNRSGLNDMNRSNLMIKAGNLLMKKKWDSSNRVDIDPFRNSGLLSERQAKVVMGEL